MAYKSSFLQNLNSTDLSNESLGLPNEDEESYIIVDSGLRKINIPEELKTIGVQLDNNAETVFIRIPRYFDGVDLFDHDCLIRYVNAGSEYGEYKITKKQKDDNYIILAWTIDNYVTRYAGNVSFTLQFETSPDYQWQTTPATFLVLKGIDVDSTITEKDNILFRTLAAQIQDLTARFDNLENSVNGITDLNIETELNSVKNRLSYLENNVVYTISNV